MRRNVTTTIPRALLVIFGLLTTGAQAFDNTHPLWTEVLLKYETNDGWMKYRQLKTDVSADKNHAFSRYLHEITSVKKTEFDGWGREHQMAFLINAYNAFTIKLVIDNYPLKSIKDLGSLFRSPWKKEFFSLFQGAVKTLDPIEHEFLRPIYRDFRVHAALNCASRSCPRMQPVAFIGDKLNVQLEDAFREFVNDSNRNRFEPESGKLMLSQIFDWFEKDFEPAGGVLKTIEKYAPVNGRQAIKNGGNVRYLTYDWSLNDLIDNSLSTKRGTM